VNEQDTTAVLSPIQDQAVEPEQNSQPEPTNSSQGHPGEPAGQAGKALPEKKRSGRIPEPKQDFLRILQRRLVRGDLQVRRSADG
jgi:ribose-phosphate pyrophosphokinase